MTPEGKIVAYLLRECKVHGFAVRKLSYEGRVGAPDRLILAYGAAAFVEVKAPGETPRPEQLREIALLNKSGLFACCVSSKEDVDRLINSIFCLANMARDGEW